RNSILMGNDFYELPHEIAADAAAGITPLGVGDGSHIEGAIIDKNCRIGRNVRVINTSGVENSEETSFGMIRDGIFVIAKGTTLPDGWVL
ncbi:MAG: glucose-1-phosphate adenylyltransferase, partial [Thermoguttaceae bacterium]